MCVGGGATEGRRPEKAHGRDLGMMRQKQSLELDGK